VRAAIAAAQALAGRNEEARASAAALIRAAGAFSARPAGDGCTDAGHQPKPPWQCPDPRMAQQPEDRSVARSVARHVRCRHATEYRRWDSGAGVHRCALLPTRHMVAHDNLSLHTDRHIGRPGKLLERPAAVIRGERPVQTWISQRTCRAGSSRASIATGLLGAARYGSNLCGAWVRES
jgi:hypothetical protein